MTTTTTERGVRVTERRVAVVGVEERRRQEEADARARAVVEARREDDRYRVTATRYAMRGYL